MSDPSSGPQHTPPAGGAANNTDSARFFFMPNLFEARLVLVLIVVAELMAVLVSLVAAYFDAFSWEQFGMTSLFIQWVALISAGLLGALRNWLQQLPMSLAASLIALVVVLNTLVFSVLGRTAIAWAVRDYDPFYQIFSYEILINVAIAAILTALFMRYFYVQEQLRLKGEAELQARIQALQSRIRPHFLFNSMNIIASLIAVEPEQAEQVVEDLSRLFRASLKETGDEVTLREELDLCERYTRIESWRIGDRLHMDWQIELDPQQVRIPLLTLQPLLENAIYHGIQPRTEGGTVTVRARYQGDRVELMVSNPFDQHARDMSKHKGNQMALDNTRHRLAALYGDEASLKIDSEGGVFRVMIEFPTQKQHK